MISPRIQFQTSLKPDSVFRSVMRSDEIQRAFAFALAQLALSSPSSDELKGATKFIEFLTDLAEPIKEPARFLDKKLDHSVFNPVEMPQGDQKKK